jgi:hypothetical protein
MGLVALSTSRRSEAGDDEVGVGVAVGVAVGVGDRDGTHLAVGRAVGDGGVDPAVELGRAGRTGRDRSS